MNNEEIKLIIENILKALSVSFNSVDCRTNDIGTIFMIATDDAKFIIGRDGANLSALNHVVKRVADKNSEGDKRYGFSIDVNEYQSKKNEEIKNKALILADRVKSFHTNQEMDPMSSYERMVVHSIL